MQSSLVFDKEKNIETVLIEGFLNLEVWKYVENSDGRRYFMGSVSFVRNLKAYIEGMMVDVSDPDIASFPIGSIQLEDCSLPEISVCFMHDKNYKKAYDSYHRRCQRIRYDNIFYLWEVNEVNTKYSLIKKFDNLPIKKMIFCYDNFPGITDYHRFYFFSIFFAKANHKKISNWKRDIDKFNYLNFLNEKSQRRNKK